MRILFTSISFPPKKDPECIQTAKYFKYLSKQKELSIDVLTSAIPTLFMPYAKGMEKYNKGYDQLIDIKIRENKYLNYLLRKISLRLVEAPDSKNSFHRQWKTAIRKIKNRPDLIYSRSYPLSSAMMALKVSQHYKVPWVMHLSDPWTITPLHDYENDSYHNLHESACFAAAAAISVTSEKTKELYIQKYPQHKQKFQVFPNVFDLDDKPRDTILTAEDKLNIVYTGGLAGNRNPRFLFEAINELYDENPDLFKKLQFTFAGPADREALGYFDQAKDKNFIHYLGEVDINRALELQKSANVLLLIDNPFQEVNQALFLPSKLLDYMLAGKRIFALSTPEGTTHQCLKSLNYNLAFHKDIEGIKTIIKVLVENFENKNTSYFLNKEIPDQFSAEHNAQRLFQLFEQLIP